MRVVRGLVQVIYDPVLVHEGVCSSSNPCDCRLGGAQHLADSYALWIFLAIHSSSAR